MWSRHSTGRVVVGQDEALLHARLDKRDGTRRGVIYCHNLGAGALTPLDPTVAPGTNQLLRAIADAGFPVLTHDFGYGAFGNPAAVELVEAARQVLQFSPAQGGGGAKAGPVILLGVSMGGALAVNYAKTYRANVRALLGVVPLSDLDDARNNNRPNGWTGAAPNAPINVNAINTAYGLPMGSTGDYPLHGSSLVPLPAGANPAIDYAGAVGIPAKAWYADSDATVPPATVIDLWAHKLGGEAVDISPGPDLHDEAAIERIDPDDVLRFLWPHAA